jgi:lipopolysaccharide/colanic/teichoic acid biosynthesis glycosyltransferase
MFISRLINKRVQHIVKRIIDIIGATMLLVVLSPLLVLITLLVKLTSPGPIFYCWKVVGKDGYSFVSYKFRTMVKDAEQMEKELRANGLNEMKGVYFKIRDDPRITGIGKLLRKYSLDELPTLYSVVKGDMSLVGPRPARIHEFEQFGEWHKRRLAVMPGLTGLWQVSGKNKVNDFDEIVKIDLGYIENWSLWLDLKILLQTIPVVLVGDNY